MAHIVELRIQLSRTARLRQISFAMTIPKAPGCDAHTANTTVGQVPDDKGGVANLGGISLANLLRCQRVSTGRRVVVDARADAGWGTDEPIELSSVQFHSAT